jgi:curved DNA-binding protein CbpA
MAPDYYRVLGVERGASEAALKASFRALAKRLHPDLNPKDQGAEAAFKAVNEAYSVLSDARERAKYDSAHAWAGLPLAAQRRSGSSGGGGRGAAPAPPPRAQGAGGDAWGDYLREEASHERAAQRLREAAARGEGGGFYGGSRASEDRHEGWEARRAARVAATEAAAAASAAARGASETGHYRAYAGQWRARQGGSGSLWPALLFMGAVTLAALQATGSLSSQASSRRK